MEKVPNANEIVPSPEKCDALKAILAEKIKQGDKMPVKMIKEISVDRGALKVLFDFVPTEFLPRHSFSGEVGKSLKPVEAFEGSASDSSYNENLENGEKTAGISTQNPKEFQATVFVDQVVDYEL
jgi:hypothetical protein